MRDIFGRLTAPFTGHSGLIKRLHQLRGEIASIAAPLQADIEKETARRKEIVDVIDGVFIRKAEKKLFRTLELLRAEESELRRKLQSNPQPVVGEFLQENRALENQIRAALLEPPKITSLNEVGEWMQQTFIERDSALECIEELRRRMSAAGDLITADLSAAELKTKIDELRAMRLPEVRTKKLYRENRPDAEVQESLV